MPCNELFIARRSAINHNHFLKNLSLFHKVSISFFLKLYTRAYYTIINNYT